MTNQVHTPYHFVPLSKWVYMPDWAHLVSHDHPFEDGHSGIIDYTLTNHSPLCVGGEQERKPGEPTHVRFAKNPFGKSTIPGSSLKGMIRNVVEIATFGKMGAVEDHHFSYRDISNGQTTYSKELQDTKAQAYWLKFDEKEGKWTFRRCNHISLFNDDLNKAYGTDIQNIALKAQLKYEQLPLSESVNFNVGERKIEGTRGKMVTVACAQQLGAGSKRGHAIFTGFRPGKKQYSLGRLNTSYVFFDESMHAEVKSGMDKIVQRLFEIHDPELVSYLRLNPHPSLGIPVFARETSKGEILALGFAKMPRKLYKLSVHDVLNSNQHLAQSQNTFDLPELMFGTLRDKGFGLKSRVSFSDALCTQSTGLTRSKPAILGQPQASFLGGYIEQTDKSGAKQLANYENGSQLKGWKRYPRQDAFTPTIPIKLQSKLNVQSTLEVMAPGAEFKGRIAFHNLKTAELGALIWCMRLQQAQQRSHHSLGHGKPLGAGQVTFSSIKLSNLRSHSQQVSLDEAVDQFITLMTENHPDKEWAESAQLSHLLQFGQENDADLSYMLLEEYTAAQKQRSFLPDWNGLTRSEAILQTAPSSFAKGRLSELFEALQDSEYYAMLSKETEFAQAAKQQQAKQKLASMPLIDQQFIALCSSLDQAEVRASKERRQALNSEVEDILNAALQAPMQHPEQFMKLCRDTSRTAYLDLAKNKKNKPKLVARKALLQQFVEHYQLEE